MDVLRILGSTDLEVRRKTLDFLMSLISLRNVKDVVSLLKKEVIKTYSNTDKDRELIRTNKNLGALARALMRLKIIYESHFHECSKGIKFAYIVFPDELHPQRTLRRTSSCWLRPSTSVGSSSPSQPRL